MLKIFGTAALSGFRINKLLSQLQSVAPDVQTISAQFVHFIHIVEELRDQETKILKRLLNYGSAIDSEVLTGTQFIVVPRAGTISPWSSKATEIAQRCGLKNVKSIERGIVFTLASSSELTESQYQQILPFCMTG